MVYTHKKFTGELKKYNDELNKKLNRNDSYSDKIKTLPRQMMVQNKNSSPENKESNNSQDPTTAVPDNNKAPPLEGGHYMKIGGIWTVNHEIRSSKFYEILIKKEIKGDNDMYLMNFYNHTNIFFNTVTIL